MFLHVTTDPTRLMSEHVSNLRSYDRSLSSFIMIVIHGIYVAHELCTDEMYVLHIEDVRTVQIIHFR